MAIIMCDIPRCRQTDVCFMYYGKELCQKCVDKFDTDQLKRKLGVGLYSNKENEVKEDTRPFKMSEHQKLIKELLPEKWAREEHGEVGRVDIKTLYKKNSNKEHNDKIRQGGRRKKN